MGEKLFNEVDDEDI